jgi:hypothetical protein
MSCRDCTKGHCDRWDHLVAIVRMTDEVQRCNCGGIFVYGAGRMKCNLCSAFFQREVVSVDADIGKSLKEIIYQKYREAAKRQTRWIPSDDDVKVTVRTYQEK